MFLNQKSLILIESNYRAHSLILENIFNPKYYKKETQENFQKVYDEILNLTKKEYKDANNIFYNPKSEKLKEIKKSFLDFRDCFKRNYNADLKSPIIVLEKNIDPNIEVNEQVRKKFLSFFENFKEKFFTDPHTYIMKLVNNETKAYFYLFFINVPKPSYLKKIFQPFYRDFGRLYDHKLINDLMYYLVLFHEMIEANESIRVLNKKSISNGIIVLKYHGKEYTVGYHQSLVVLAKEAYVLNKFYKDFKIIEEFRNYRQLYEWRIIKEVTGFDFSKIDTYNEAYFEKLRKIKPAGKEIGYIKGTLGVNKILNLKDLKDLKDLKSNQKELTCF